MFFYIFIFFAFNGRHVSFMCLWRDLMKMSSHQPNRIHLYHAIARILDSHYLSIIMTYIKRWPYLLFSHFFSRFIIDVFNDITSIFYLATFSQDLWLFCEVELLVPRMRNWLPFELYFKPTSTFAFSRDLWLFHGRLSMAYPECTIDSHSPFALYFKPTH